MQTIVEIPKTEEQLRRAWGMGFKSIEQETVQIDDAPTSIEIDKENEDKE